MLMSVPTHTKALDLAYIALMAALIALCAWISVPLGPVPFTMQTFGIFAALGGRRGTLAFLIYLLLGIVGLPVFSGFSAGAGVLFGATGGYLLGYLAAALLFWETHFPHREFPLQNYTQLQLYTFQLSCRGMDLPFSKPSDPSSPPIHLHHR